MAVFIANEITSVLGISLPIIQAPMAGGGDTVELVAAVSNAGALGSIGAAYLSPEQIVERGKAVRAKTSRPFGVNLFAPMPRAEVSGEEIKRAIDVLAPFYEELGISAPSEAGTPKWTFDDQLAAGLETDASVFSVTFGLLPESAIGKIKRRKMLVVGTATTVIEAKVLVSAGVDAVVAQGSEAGGHRGTFATDFGAAMVGTISLVPQIRDAVSVPVIASGGIMDGRGIVAALALGASAVQLGTAFLTCQESGVAEAYKEAILTATEDSTRITRAFSGRPARGIVNRFLSQMELRESEILPFPLQNLLTRPMRNESTRRNNAEYLSLWAGQGVRLARRESAAELVERLAKEMEERLTEIGRLTDGRIGTAAEAQKTR